MLMFPIFIFGRVPKEILDDVRLGRGVGYDSTNKRNEMEITGIYAVYNLDKTITDKVLVTKSSLSKESLSMQNEQSDVPLVNGKLEVALYEKELSKKRIMKFIDTFHRDANINSRLLIAIVDGKAKEVLEKRYGNAGTGIYLASLLEHNMKYGLLPQNNLHVFLSSYFSKGKDPVLPLLKLKGKNIRIDGLALLKKDKYIKKLHRDHMFTFKALLENVKLGSLKVKLNNNVDVSLQSIKTQRKFLIQNSTTLPEITVHLKIKGTIREFQGKKIEKDVIRLTKNAVQHSIEKQGNEFIKECQTLHIDPLGIGHEARSYIRHWNAKNGMSSMLT